MDAKSLTDFGLNELEVNASTAVTDYVIVVDPHTWVPKKALVSTTPLMAGVTSTAAEINYNDLTALGTGEASKAVVLDAGEDYIWPAAGVLTYGVLKDPAGTTLGATVAELNAAADNSAIALLQTVSTVVAASAASVQTSVERKGDIIKTTIAIDLAGLKSTATNKDIIGDTGVSHIGQITTARNGIIVKGQISCGEVPTTGDDDIDLYAADEATGAYDADVEGLTETLLMASAGAYAIGTVKNLTALPAADQYLYLTTGDATAGTYDAGKIMIELWGTVA